MAKSLSSSFLRENLRALRTTPKAAKRRLQKNNTHQKAYRSELQKPQAIRFYSSCFFTYKYAFFSLPTRSKTPMEYSTFAAHCACVCARRIAFASVFVVNGSGRS